MKLNSVAIAILHKFPYVRNLYEEKMNFEKNSCHPIGHYYSAITSVDEIKNRQEQIWHNEKEDGVAGIRLNTTNQVTLIKAFEEYYAEMPFTKYKIPENRYYFENGYYPSSDAILLYSMIRHFSPKQIVEIGSGFSSSVMLDTNARFFSNSIKLTFIEPFPERLNSLVYETDHRSITLIEQKVQDVNVETFTKLNAGDFLFIDSTHVVKTGNDVNYILFEIIPRLQSGVIIHFHDIFYPFEYPRDWVFMGRNWNESYFVRSFLMYNEAYEILLFSDYLHKHHPVAFANMPLCYKNSGILWLLKK